jgi:hypothetical protein
MHDRSWTGEAEQWVIWNGASGILAMASVGRIAFAACMVMSRQRWQDDQVDLRQQAFEKRRVAQERLRAEQARFKPGRRRGAHGQPLDERHHRETLKLPAEGALEPHQIKKAYRRLAQKAHPDAGGGSHEQLLRLTEAGNALLELSSLAPDSATH